MSQHDGQKARLIDRWPQRGGNQSRSDQPRDGPRSVKVKSSTARITDAISCRRCCGCRCEGSGGVGATGAPSATPLAAGCWLLAAGCWLPASSMACIRVAATHRSSAAVDGIQPTVGEVGEGRGVWQVSAKGDDKGDWRAAGGIPFAAAARRAMLAGFTRCRHQGWSTVAAQASSGGTAPSSKIVLLP
jgi:hypothetical protein